MKFFTRYIITPIVGAFLSIKRFINFYFKHSYVEDTPENRKLLLFYQKVINNPQYEPEGAIEVFHNGKMREWYEEDKEDEDISWEQYRKEVCCEFAYDFMSRYWMTEEEAESHHFFY